MQASATCFNRKSRSRTYSIRAENRKKRLSERRKNLGRPTDEAKSRKEFWAGYFSLIQKASEDLEDGYNANGGFEDRLEAQREYFQSFPFRLVVRYLSDDAFSYMKRLPLSNGAEITTLQPKGYRYAGTIPTAEKESLLSKLFEEEMEEIKIAKVPEISAGYIPRINVYVRKDFSELKKDVQKITNTINEGYGWFGKKLEDIMPTIGERERKKHIAERTAANFNKISKRNIA
jgi:hypothetical protein